MPLKPLQMLQHKTRLRPELLLRWIQQTQQRWTGCFSWGLLTDDPGRTGGLSSTIGICMGFAWDFIGISLGFHGISLDKNWDLDLAIWIWTGFHGDTIRDILKPGLVNIQKTIEHGPVEIVDLPNYIMVDLSIVIFDKLPGRVTNLM